MRTRSPEFMKKAGALSSEEEHTKIDKVQFCRALAEKKRN